MASSAAACAHEGKRVYCCVVRGFFFYPRPIVSIKLKKILKACALCRSCPHSKKHSLPQVVICGGGVIGASVAYYLSKRGVKPVIIDRCKVLCTASAKARDYFSRASLARGSNIAESSLRTQVPNLDQISPFALGPQLLSSEFPLALWHTPVV